MLMDIVDVNPAQTSQISCMKKEMEFPKGYRKL